MYRNCIFCSVPLGANDMIEAFPVATQIAFDSWKGRLWAVCPHCAGWNLAPIEERWEPVEQAEELFCDAALRVQSENIGLARLPDGTRLIRIGKALPGELAAWRYGTQLLHRRHRHILGAAGVAGVLTAATVLPILPFVGAVGSAGTFAVALYPHMQRIRQRKVVHRLRTSVSGETAVRRWHIGGMSVSPTKDGDVEILVRDLRNAPGVFRQPPMLPWDIASMRLFWHDVATVAGDEARVLLVRSLVHVNRSGASRNSLQSATELLSAKRSSEEYLHDVVSARFSLGTRADDARLSAPHRLALEMALNEASERRALEGELAALEQAWREAEEIAAIADSLPDPIRLPHWLRG